MSATRCPSSSVAGTLTSTVPEEAMAELQESRVLKVSPETGRPIIYVVQWEKNSL